jgi:uncharacterized protein (DUF433 family)
MQEQKIGGKRMRTKKLAGKIQWDTEHDKIIQYFPHIWHIYVT